MMVVPKYETKSDWTTGQIRSAILDGRIAPGERIRIQQWAKRLGVSPTPLREAMKALEAEGYVRISPHRGAEATAFSSKEFSDLYRIQQALDTLAIEFVVQRLVGTHRASVCRRLYLMNQEMREALQAADARRADRLNRDLHRAIYEAADSPRLLQASTPLWSGIPVAGRVFWKDVMSSPERIEGIWSEHDAIVRAIESGDRSAAIEATRRHQDSARQRLQATETYATSATRTKRTDRRGRRRVAAAG